MDALSQTNARRVTVHGSVDLEALDGIRDIRSDDKSVSFLYSGDMNRLIGRLSEGDVYDLSVSEPDLEEICMHYYEKAGDRA